MRFDRDKFKALVHYIVWKCPDPAKLGSTKLNKILWLTDSRAYVLHKQPITGATYIRQKYGPVPHQIMPIRSELESEGAIKATRQRLFNHEQDIFTTDRAPDMGAFTRDELRLVDYWINEVTEKHTAASISDMTHDYVWEIAKMGEEIPLYAVRVANIEDPTDEQVERLKARARELGVL